MDTSSYSEEVKIVQFVPIFENVPLNLGRVHPGYKVFHITSVTLEKRLVNINPNVRTELLGRLDL